MVKISHLILTLFIITTTTQKPQMVNRDSTSLFVYETTPFGKNSLFNCQVTIGRDNNYISCSGRRDLDEGGSGLNTVYNGNIIFPIDYTFGSPLNPQFFGFGIDGRAQSSFPTSSSLISFLEYLGNHLQTILTVGNGVATGNIRINYEIDATAVSLGKLTGTVEEAGDWNTGKIMEMGGNFLLKDKAGNKIHGLVGSNLITKISSFSWDVSIETSGPKPPLDMDRDPPSGNDPNMFVLTPDDLQYIPNSMITPGGGSSTLPVTNAASLGETSPGFTNLKITSNSKFSISCNGANHFLVAGEYSMDSEFTATLKAKADRSGAIGTDKVLFDSLNIIHNILYGYVITTPNLETIPNTRIWIFDLNLMDSYQGTLLDLRYSRIDLDMSGEGGVAPYVITSIPVYEDGTDFFIFPTGVNGENKPIIKIFKVDVLNCHNSCLSCDSANNPTACFSCFDLTKVVFPVTTGGKIGTCKIPCHTSCAECEETIIQKSSKCTSCPPGKFLAAETGPSFCGDCHEACNGCTVAFNDEKCLNCATGYIEDSNGKCVVDVWVNQRNIINLEEKKCGNFIVPGCVKCLQEESKGCESCQKGSGIEIREENSYCVPCPDPKCEVCRISRVGGRQCQKCFDGFKYDHAKQRCFIGVFVLGFFEFLSLLLVFW